MSSFRIKYKKRQVLGLSADKIKFQATSSFSIKYKKCRVSGVTTRNVNVRIIYNYARNDFISCAKNKIALLRQVSTIL